jgi:opacity protein-like surface antigen
MKNLIFAAVLLVSCSCTVLKQQPVERTHLSLIEIKNIHGLTNKETRAIVQAAKRGEINLIYHAGRDRWMLDANYDYSQFKTDTDEK